MCSTYTSRNRTSIRSRDSLPPVINYSLHVTGIPIREMRAVYPQAVIMGGVDEVHYRTLPPAEIRKQWKAAAAESGKKYILTPGCSVPNESSDAELLKLSAVMGA